MGLRCRSGVGVAVRARLGLWATSIAVLDPDHFPSERFGSGTHFMAFDL